MIADGKQFDNRYTTGQQAMDQGDWLTAYACFSDCLEYLEEHEGWSEDEIESLEELINHCRLMF